MIYNFIYVILLFLFVLSLYFNISEKVISEEKIFSRTRNAIVFYMIGIVIAGFCSFQIWMLVEKIVFLYS